MNVRNTIIVTSVLCATGAVSLGVYCVGPYRPYVDPLATEVYVSVQMVPPNRARYEAKRAIYERMLADTEEHDYSREIPEVVLRHQTFSAEWGRVTIDLPAQGATEFLGQLGRKMDFLIFQASDTFPRNLTLGPLKGTFTYDEALDLALRGKGCSWFPASEHFVTFDCGLGT